MTKKTLPAYVRLLRQPHGATRESLRIAMNRIWAPVPNVLTPVANRHGYVLAVRTGRDGLVRYAFKRTEAEAAAFAAR